MLYKRKCKKNDNHNVTGDKLDKDWNSRSYKKSVLPVVNVQTQINGTILTDF